MNLPGTALEFLDAFRGVLAPLREEDGFEGVYDRMPVVHCHCFTKEMERVGAEVDIRQVRFSFFSFFHSVFNTSLKWTSSTKRAEAALGEPLPEDTTFHFVRKVSPKKDMYCVSFTPSRELMVGAGAP